MMSGNESIGVSYCTILSREEEKSIVMLGITVVCKRFDDDTTLLQFLR